MIYENAYLQALYDFETTQDNEISFKAGDILKALHRVNQDWFYGKVISEDNSNCGNFPLAFVSVIDIPTNLIDNTTGECLYLATNNFPKMESGDLDFLKGQLLVGKKQVDQNWCSGCYLTNTARAGIFPLTHVKKIHFTSDLSVVNNTNGIIRNARVIEAFEKSCDEHLNLTIGDYVLVTNEIDSNWLFGESISGQKGMFPRNCIEFTDVDDENTNNDGNTAILNRTQRRRFMSFDVEDVEPEAKPTLVVDNNYQHENVYEQEQEYANINEYDYPTLEATDEDTVTLTNDLVVGNVESNGTGVKCVVLYNFCALGANELDCKKDEQLEIIDDVDDGWYNSRNERGQKGLVPKSYVKMLDGEESFHDESPRYFSEASISPRDPSPDKYQKPIFEIYENLPDEPTPVVTEVVKASVSEVKPLPVKPKVPPKPKRKVEEPKVVESNVTINQRLSLPAFELVSNKEQYLDANTKIKTTSPSLSVKTTIDDNSTNLSKTNSISYKDLLKKFETPSETSTKLVVPSKRSTASKVNGDTNVKTNNETIKKPVPPPIPRKPAFLQANSENAIYEPKFIEDLKLRIKQLNSLMSEQEKLNENFTKENELITIDDDQKQMNEAKLNYYKNELTKLNEILYRMEPEDESLKTLTPENQMNTNSIASSILRDSIRTPEVTDDKKQISQRKKIINELLTTEKEFHKQLSALYECFFDERNFFAAPAEFDKLSLLGNLDEILNISLHFISLLDQEVVRDENDIKIGICLLACANDIQQYYATYCRNHSNIFELMRKYESNPAINDYIKSKCEQIKSEMNNLSLLDILIKPVQRVTKYPLFIDQLIKNTPDTHCDYPDLIEARDVYKQVLLFINEYKRRKDLILKYTKDDQRNMLEKIKWNTIRKKYSRMGTMLTTFLGLEYQTIDLKFSQEEDTFRTIEKNIKGLIKEVNEYTKYLKDSFDCQMSTVQILLEIYKDDEDCKAVFRLLQNYLKNVLNKHNANFTNETNKQVIQPLTKLIKLYELPNKLIEKRFNKLLDYDKAKADFDKTKIIERRDSVPDVDTRMLDYQALNAQLLDELPILVNRSSVILLKCSKTFLKLLTSFIDDVMFDLHELKKDQIIIKCISIRNFDKSYLDHFNSLSFFFSNNRKSLSIENTSSRSSLSLQTDSRRDNLKKKYTADKLYRVIRDNDGNESSCLLGAFVGDVVAVLKHSYIDGRSDLWFVDNGEEKGFLPAEILAPISVETEQKSASARSNLIDAPIPVEAEQNKSASARSSLIDIDDLPPGYDEKSQTLEYESCIALYNFVPTSSNMISMKEHEAFLVIRKCDDVGDPQWYLVQNEKGEQGYVPSNYILILT